MKEMQRVDLHFSMKEVAMDELSFIAGGTDLPPTPPSIDPEDLPPPPHVGAPLEVERHPDDPPYQWSYC